jgi:hypothetical protein
VNVQTGFIDILAEPGGETDDHAAVGAFSDELIQRGLELDAAAGGRAPVLSIPLRQQLPSPLGAGGDEVRIGIDAHGIIATLLQLIERFIPVLVAGAGPAALEP